MSFDASFHFRHCVQISIKYSNRNSQKLQKTDFSRSCQFAPGKNLLNWLKTSFLRVLDGLKRLSIENYTNLGHLDNIASFYSTGGFKHKKGGIQKRSKAASKRSKAAYSKHQRTLRQHQRRHQFYFILDFRPKIGGLEMKILSISRRLLTNIKYSHTNHQMLHFLVFQQ